MLKWLYTQKLVNFSQCRCCFLHVLAFVRLMDVDLDANPSLET